MLVLLLRDELEDVEAVSVVKLDDRPVLLEEDEEVGAGIDTVNDGEELCTELLGDDDGLLVVVVVTACCKISVAPRELAAAHVTTPPSSVEQELDEVE